MTGPDVNTQDTRPAVTTQPLLGVAGVLLGALIATCTGPPDERGFGGHSRCVASRCR
jgi:hypothetical protein